MKREAAAFIRDRPVHLTDKRRQATWLRERRQRPQCHPLNVRMRIVEGPGQDGPTWPVADKSETPGATCPEKEVQAAEEVERPIGN